MDSIVNHPYCIMNSNGFVIEKSEGFNNNINGQITDIVQKSKKILAPDTINSFEIFFENKNILIKENTTNDFNITMLVSNK